MAGVTTEPFEELCPYCEDEFVIAFADVGADKNFTVKFTCGKCEKQFTKDYILDDKGMIQDFEKKED